MGLLNKEKISRVFWEPYILTGYRQTNTTYWQCIKYTCTLHNDCGNFWTHFTPLLIWIPWLYHLSYQLDFTDPYWYPLLMLWAGGCSYAFCSSMAHCFACKSLNVRQICFMIDYHGISMYTFGGEIAYYFYERPANMEFFNYTWTFVFLSMAVSLSATFLCSLSRFFWEKYRYLMRAGAFVLPYITGCSPFFFRFVSCIFTGVDCVAETLPFHFVAFMSSHLMVFFFVTKIPERLFPGRFDYFFHSHQLFHVFAITVTSLQFYFIPKDALIRQSILLNGPISSNVYNTIIPFLVVCIIGFGIVGVFGYFVLNGTLVSNKKHE